MQLAAAASKRACDKQSNTWNIKDCGSTNGVFVERQKIAPDILVGLAVYSEIVRVASWLATQPLRGSLSRAAAVNARLAYTVQLASCS